MVKVGNRIEKTTTKAVPLTTRGMIIRSFELGQAYSEICKTYNISKSTFYNIKNKASASEDGTAQIGKSSGRPPILNARDKRQLLYSVNSEPFTPINKLAKDLNIPCSARTAQRIVLESGLRTYNAAKKPYISKANCKIRYAWAKEHVSWTQEQWENIIFSDESPITLRDFGSKKVRRPRGKRYNIKYLLPTIKHPTKINVWGCFGFNGVGNLAQIKGLMDANQFISIMKTNLMQSVKKIKGFYDYDIIFQQDNDPKHTCDMVVKWFEEKGITVLNWPSYSPDLNPIENLWAILKSSIADRNPTNEAELFALVNKAWDEIPNETLKNLVKSMPRRCQAVIDSKGYPTKY
jgi:transposase